MTNKIEKLKESFAKSTERVEKIKKTIERHQKQLEKKIAAGADKWDIEWKEDDIKNAQRKLEDAEAINANWKTKLTIELEKTKFVENESPQVIHDFLNDWEEKTVKWNLNRYEKFKEFRIRLEQEVRHAKVEFILANPEYERYVKYVNNPEDPLLNLFPRKPIETMLEEKGLDWKSVDSREQLFAGPKVLQMKRILNKEEREQWLKDKVEKEKNSKMFNLINRIAEEVGKITDASQLSINPKGDLDGIVIGESGSVELKTIGSGGYNIQCFHYRTLIKKLK